jgi:hypothetical protein
MNNAVPATLLRTPARRPAIQAFVARAVSDHQRPGLRWNREKLKVTFPDPVYTVKYYRIEALKKLNKAR